MSLVKFEQSGLLGSNGITDLLFERRHYPDDPQYKKQYDELLEQQYFTKIGEWDKSTTYNIYANINNAVVGVNDLIIATSCPDGYVDARAPNSKGELDHMKSGFPCIKYGSGPKIKNVFIDFATITNDEFILPNTQGAKLRYLFVEKESYDDYCRTGYNSILPECREWCKLNGCNHSAEAVCKSTLMTKSDNDEFDNFCSFYRPEFIGGHYEVKVDGNNSLKIMHKPELEQAYIPVNNNLLPDSITVKCEDAHKYESQIPGLNLSQYCNNEQPVIKPTPIDTPDTKKSNNELSIITIILVLLLCILVSASVTYFAMKFVVPKIEAILYKN